MRCVSSGVLEGYDGREKTRWGVHPLLERLVEQFQKKLISSFRPYRVNGATALAPDSAVLKASGW